MALLSGLAVVFFSHGIAVPHWIGSWGPQGFGPFPNRNHHGCFIAMGLVVTVAAGDDAFRHRKRWVILYILCLIPMFWALTKNLSRAAIILSFVGLVAWMGLTSFRNRSSRRIAISAAILLTLTALFVLFGKTIVKRLQDTISPSGVLLDGRVEIFETSLDMISLSPLLGVGLGNFEPVYALIRRPTEQETRIIHPESDWLWLAAETGLPAAVLMSVAAIAFIFYAGPWLGRASSDAKPSRLRAACAISALLVPIHGSVDVPGHNPGIAFTAILLAGLAIRHGGPHPEVKAHQSALPRLGAAIFSLAAASAWLGTSLGNPILPGNSSAEMLRHRAFQERDRGDLTSARQLLTHALSMKPLLWEGYFDRAAMALPLGLPAGDALLDFARARYLEPNSANICNQEALMWLAYYPQYAVAAWRTAISRSPTHALFFYSELCSRLQKHPDLRSATRRLATDAKLMFVYLLYAEHEDFAGALTDLLSIDPELTGLSAEDRLRVFRFWYARGDRATLLDALEHKATWRAEGWPVLAAGRAGNNDFKGACEVAMQYLVLPPEAATGPLGDIEKLRREFLFHSNDYKYGFELYEVEKAKGLVSDALLTLEKISQIPNAPLKVFYEHALMLMQKGDYQKAWGKMSAYIEARERAKQSGGQ